MLKTSALVFAAIALSLAALWGSHGAAIATISTVRTYYGAPVSIGHGTARIVEQADGRRPIAIGLELTPGALLGLPKRPGSGQDWFLQTPKAAPATGLDHVMIDWNPLGHPPPVYEVAHFDFHFYYVSRRSQMAIRYAHPESSNMAGVVMPPEALLPPGYMIPPGTQVDEMGLHAVAGNAPEFHGKPFTSTFIYGYDANGRLAFFEPMAAMRYLLSHPHLNAVVVRPSTYSFPGYYPGSYSVSFDPGTRTYRIMLTGLRPWRM